MVKLKRITGSHQKYLSLLSIADPDHKLIQPNRQQGFKIMIVGTANSSLQNLKFYQRFGFRFGQVVSNFFNQFMKMVYRHLIWSVCILNCDIIHSRNWITVYNIPFDNVKYSNLEYR